LKNKMINVMTSWGITAFLNENSRGLVLVAM